MKNRNLLKAIYGNYLFVVASFSSTTAVAQHNSSSLACRIKIYEKKNVEGKSISSPTLRLALKHYQFITSSISRSLGLFLRVLELGSLIYSAVIARNLASKDL